MSIGESLRAARTDAGLSVDDLSRQTRIRGQLIREIEADDFHGCGGSVYARGHVRALAVALRVDPVPLVAEFDRVHGASDVPQARDIFEHEVLDIPHRSAPNWTGAMVVAAAVLLVVALVSLFNSDSTRPSDPLRAADTFPSSSPSASPTPAAAPSKRAEEPIAGVIGTEGVFVRVRIVNTRSWVAAIVDGKPTFGRTLAAGTEIDFRGRRAVRLTLGNAGAVQLVVNGRDLGTPGRAGAVLRLEFGPGDPVTGSPG